MNMKWKPALIAIANGEPLGACPYCHKPRLTYGFVRVSGTDNMGYGAIWCEHCHHGYYMFRVHIQPGMKMADDVPHNLIL